jgi:hypothetical protein
MVGIFDVVDSAEAVSDGKVNLSPTAKRPAASQAIILDLGLEALHGINATTGAKRLAKLR